jgi:hypothetical protein
MEQKIKKLKTTRHAKKLGAKLKAPTSERDIDFVSYEPIQGQPEIPRFRIVLAKIFQNLAYTCLFVGCVVLIGSVAGLIITYSQPEPNLDSAVTNPTGDGWLNLQLLTYALIMYRPAVIIFEILIAILVIALIIWGWKVAIRNMRRLAWRLADAIMKPLILVEPIFLLTVWALTIVMAWFLVDDATFLVASLACLAFLLVGLLSFLIMRKLADNRLDFTRAELMWHKK